jgi:hypothetical protein
MLLSAHHEPMSFVLPGQEEVRWELVLDTRLEAGFWKIRKFLLPRTNTQLAIALSLCCV